MTRRSSSSARWRESPAEPSPNGDLTLPFDRLEPAADPDLVLHLFVSMPDYAVAERHEILNALHEINTAAGGQFAVRPAGSPQLAPANGDQAANLTAADCDAVFAIMRPRLATDPPGDGAAQGAGSVLSAVGSGAAGLLPDIAIFRYSEATVRAAGDPDWENGKRAFAGWFASKGGKTLAFEDFSSAEEFGGKLRVQLAAWLGRMDLPPPAVEAEPEGEALEALAAEIAAPEESEPAPVAPSASEAVLVEAPEIEMPAMEAAEAEPAAVETAELPPDEAEEPQFRIEPVEAVAPAPEPPGEEPAPTVAWVDEPEPPALFSPRLAARDSVDARLRARKVWRGRNRALDIDAVRKIADPPAQPVDVAPQEPVPQEPGPEAFTPEPLTPESSVAAEPPSAPEMVAANDAPAIPPVDEPQPLAAEPEAVEESRQGSLMARPVPAPYALPAPRRTAIGRPIAMSLALALAAGGLLVWGLHWRSVAEQRGAVEQTLASAADTAGGLLFDLIDESRRLGGATNAASKEILQRAQKLQGALVTAGAFDPAALQKSGDEAMAAADALSKQDKTADAIQKAIEGARAFLTLSSAEPDRLEWLERLADADIRIGDLNVARNDLVEALGSYRDAVGIRKALSQRRPDEVERRRTLALAEQKVADVLVVAGHLDEGVAGYREVLAIRKPLAQSDETNPDRQRDVMETDNKIADVLSAQTRYDEALAIYRDGFFIASRMAQKYPADTRWRGALTLTDNKIGDVQVAKGLVDDALSTYREGLANMRQLAAEDPSKTEWQSLIATCQERIGDAFAAEKHLDSALGAYRDALDTVKALAAKEPASTGWQRGVSEMQLRIGSVLYQQGSVDGAIAANKQSLEIMKALVAKEPGNARWKRDLMMDNNDLGLLYMSREDRLNAMPFYQAALAVAREMEPKEPQNTEWPGNRVLIDSNIGALLMGQGSREDGMAMYRDGLATAKALVQRDPRSAEWQGDLMVALYNVGEAGEDSEANFETALEIGRKLDAAGVLRADKKALMVKVEEDLARLKKTDAPSAEGNAAPGRPKRR
jgi:tetratricopeptide (TPR) repeat protein